MAKSKTIKHILSPEAIQAEDAINEQHEAGVQRLKSKIAEARSHTATDGGADVTNPQQQLGRGMTREAVMAKLQQLNPNLLYEQSRNYPKFGGIYFDDRSVDPITQAPVGKRQLCGIPHEIVAEFDVRLVLNEDVPDPAQPLNWITVPKIDGHIPGWRSTIMKLATKGYISLGAAENLFEVHKGRSSQKWQQAVN